jgi:hypothetical protein
MSCLQGGNSSMAVVPAGALLDIGTARVCNVWSHAEISIPSAEGDVCGLPAVASHVCKHVGALLKYSFATVAKIYRQKMYMRHFGNPSVKATCLWSNSSAIGKLNLGPVTGDSLTL